jgi:uncharacterized protein with PIN domain
MGTYSSAARRAIKAGLESGAPSRCPACGAELAIREVEPPGQVSYVRRRVWVLCPACKRTAAVDVRGGEPPSSRPGR